MYSSNEEIQEYLKELDLNQKEIRKNLSEMVIHIENMSMNELWMMNVLDRQMIIARHNKSVEKKKEA